MDVDLIFKIAAIGILVAVLNQLLVRSGREEQAMMTTLAGLVVVLMRMVQELSDRFDLIKTLFQFCPWSWSSRSPACAWWGRCWRWSSKREARRRHCC